MRESLSCWVDRSRPRKRWDDCVAMLWMICGWFVVERMSLFTLSTPDSDSLSGCDAVLVCLRVIAGYTPNSGWNGHHE